MVNLEEMLAQHGFEQDLEFVLIATYANHCVACHPVILVW